MTEDLKAPETFESSAGFVTELAKAAVELAQYASYAEIVGGMSVNNAAVREWSDRIFALNAALGKKMDDAGAPMFASNGEVLDSLDRYVTTASIPEAATQANSLAAARVEIERLRLAADYISPYLRYTIGEESPGHPPTMPSAVAAFHTAFDINTAEKRIARTKSTLGARQNQP
jgi:hypothetical protein